MAGDGSAGLPRFKVVFVLGRPGAGKGTNCEQLARDHDWLHLSAGELLREEIQSGSEHGGLISQLIHDGKIVPSEITVALLWKAMVRAGKPRVLIDGFPRNSENRAAWEAAMEGKIDFQFLLLLDCPEDVIIERLRSRGRSDDNVATMQKRIVTFNAETAPIITHYGEQARVRTINSNQEREKVYQDIVDLFQSIASDA